MGDRVRMIAHESEASLGHRVKLCLKRQKQKQKQGLLVMVHIFNPSIQKAEANLVYQQVKCYLNKQTNK